MLMEQISSLVAVCNEVERKFIEKMVLAAGDYVRIVIQMKTKSLNYAGRTGEELRSAVQESDRERSSCHNALISCVDIANRICSAHNQPPIYTGSSARREYGDFAIALVSEIFSVR